MEIKCEECNKEINLPKVMEKDFKQSMIREFRKILCEKCAERIFKESSFYKRNKEWAKNQLKKEGFSDEDIERKLK